MMRVFHEGWPGHLSGHVQKMDFEELKQEALLVKKQAYAPYSGFHVGAALLADDGHIYSGCNVENASYGATVCAERGAVSAAVAGGARRILALVVVGDSPGPTMPCGICRQFIAEFSSPDLPVLCGTREGRFEPYQLSELLPHAFIPEDLSNVTDRK